MFVGLSFPWAPVTLLIIIRYLESPATTFGLVNYIRLAAIYTTMAIHIHSQSLMIKQIYATIIMIAYFICCSDT